MANSAEQNNSDDENWEFTGNWTPSSLYHPTRSPVQAWERLGYQWRMTEPQPTERHDADSLKALGQFGIELIKPEDALYDRLHSGQQRMMDALHKDGPVNSAVLGDGLGIELTEVPEIDPNLTPEATFDLMRYRSKRDGNNRPSDSILPPEYVVTDDELPPDPFAS